MRGSAVVIKALSNIMPALWTHDQGAYFLYSQGESIPVLLTIFVFFVLALGALVFVLWIIMPFSVFGLKRLLRQCIAEQKKTNALLEKMMETNGERVVRERDLPEIKTIDDEPRDF